jgi:3-oxoacyl-(acyl-carrier-protein) synthase
MSSQEALVITGLGIVSSLGQSPQAICKKLLSGASGVKAHIVESDAALTAVALVPSLLNS